MKKIFSTLILSSTLSLSTTLVACQKTTIIQQQSITTHTNINNVTDIDSLLSLNNIAKNKYRYSTAELLLNTAYGVNKAVTFRKFDMSELIQKLDHNPIKNGKHQTVIIRTLYKSMSEQQQQALIDWVEKGGHLIVLSSGQSVSDEDWDKVSQHIASLSDKSTQEIASDPQIQQIKDDIVKIHGNSILTELGVFEVPERIYNKQEKQAFQIILDSHQLAKDTYLRDYESKQPQATLDTYYVRQNLEVFYGSDISLWSLEDSEDIDKGVDNNNLSKGIPLIPLENGLYNSKTDILYATHPQAKPYQSIKPADINAIRAYFAKQAGSAENYLATHKDSQTPVIPYWIGMNALEMNKTIELLRQMSDEQLLTMFANDHQPFTDFHFGKGRITAFSSRGLWDNPNIEGKWYAEKIAPKPRPASIFNQDRNDILTRKNARLLLFLTKNSQQILLYPNALKDID